MPITSNIGKRKGLEMEAVQSMFPRGLTEAVILHAVAVARILNFGLGRAGLKLLKHRR